MRLLERLFTKLYKKDYHMIGRWFISYNEVIINTKIDQANEDHCGCCNLIKINILDDDYYKPFIL